VELARLTLRGSVDLPLRVITDYFARTCHVPVNRGDGVHETRSGLRASRIERGEGCDYDRLEVSLRVSN